MGTFPFVDSKILIVGLVEPNEYALDFAMHGAFLPRKTTFNKICTSD